MKFVRMNESKLDYPVYGCPFKLTNPVTDVDEAQKYLDDDHKGMLRIFNSDINSEGDNPIIDWRWYLNYDNSGYFLYQTSRELTEREIKNLGEATLGQASDGLGEGFCQQPFAFYTVERNNGWYSDDDYENEYDDVIMSEFDWEENIHGYPIKLMDKRFSRCF